MKSQKKSPENTLVLRNVFSILKALFIRYRSIRWQIPVYMVSKMSVPFITTLIPTVAIAGITEGDVSFFIWSIIGILLLSAVINTVTGVLDSRITLKCQFTRRNHFCYQYVDKNLSADYSNIEPQARQNEIQKGAWSINSDWTGMEHLMKESVEIVICILGLIVYGSSVIFLDIRILLAMIVMCVLDLSLRSHAIRFQDGLMDENSEIYRTMDYLDNNGLDLKAGKDIRVYRMEGWFHAVYERVVRAASRYAARTELRWYFPNISDHICLAARDIIAYLILINMAVSGEITPAEFTFFLGLIAGFSGWMYSISLSFGRIRTSSQAINYFNTVMNTKDNFIYEGGEKAPDPDRPFSIEFRDVSFRYPGAEHDTLSHLNFTIHSGEKIALVGNNGAGKTTIVKLLCGLYQPTGGKILIDQKDITEINILEYQSLISVLFQDIQPLSFSIASNVAGCKKEDIKRERVVSCLKKAGLWEKVDSLPRKEKTYITQTLDSGGIQLSGGETQKLLLARAIYKNGSFLILDEPTAALDPIAESQMYEEYNRITKEKTSVFISHRLASTKFCDRIFFLENGRILEEGSHDRLIQKQGKYKEIFDIQSHYYQEKAVTTNGE